MKIARIGTIVLVVYVTLGLLFGGFVGYLQPQDGGTARLRTVDANGQSHETVLRLLEEETFLFVEADGLDVAAGLNRNLAYCRAIVGHVDIALESVATTDITMAT